MLDSVRVRLTAWHVAVLSLLLVPFSIGAYFFLRHHYYERADGILQAIATSAASIMQQELSESGLDELAARKATRILDFPDHTLAIYDERGDLLSERPVASSEEVRLPAGERLERGVIQLVTLRAAARGEELRRVAVLRTTLEPVGRSYTIVTTRSLTPFLGDLAADRRLLAVAIPLGIFLAGASGWFLARKSLEPVLAMSEKAARIGAENLGERLPPGNPRDELGRLAGTLNGLLERVSSAFHQRRQFMTDASHELRTPISIIRTAASVSLNRPQRTVEEYRRTLLIVDEQSRRLTRIVEDMFQLARADVGSLGMREEPLYLDELIAETVHAARLLAVSKGIEFDTPILAESPFTGDEDLLRRMVLVLLDNAIKYTPAGGRVRVELERTDSDYRIVVSDTGPGIPLAAQQLIFDRFFRVDKQRSRDLATASGGSGTGLGLAIARSIAEAHGGKIWLERSDAAGSMFVVSLPYSATSR